MAHFIPPMIQENANGWGPSAIPDQFKDMPYQPFSKGDRLGKVSDWTGATYQDKRYLGKYNSAFGGAGSQYAYYHEEDESSFQLVDTARAQRPLYQRGRRLFNQNKQRRERERRQQQAQTSMQALSKTHKNRERDRQRQLRKWQKQFGRNTQDNRNKAPIKNRDASVMVRDSWAVVEEMDFPRLAKLSLPNIEEPKDLTTRGAMELYDKSYDRVTTKAERKLKRINRIFHKVTTTDDPVIRQLAKTEGNVFATDTILATLMCCTRSVYSWDIIVQRVGNKLFFDKRDDSDFDLLTVSETATEPPQEEGNNINSPRNLALEATYINHNFSQQVLKAGEDKHKFEQPNPFGQAEDEGEVASVGYRYRKWELGNDVTLISRCEHDAVMIGPSGENQFINVKALNEWDSRYCGGVDWRTKLDSQRGAVLATELKNNSCKLAKWTVGALLSGSDQIKFGWLEGASCCLGALRAKGEQEANLYVSRLHLRDSAKHVILGTQQFKPNEFANQINLNMDNGWGLLRCIIDTCMKLKEGKYLIMKDPNKPMIRIYDIPDDTFETDEDDDTESEEEQDSDDEEDEPEK